MFYLRMRLYDWLLSLPLRKGVRRAIEESRDRSHRAWLKVVHQGPPPRLDSLKMWIGRTMAPGARLLWPRGWQLEGVARDLIQRSGLRARAKMVFCGLPFWITRPGAWLVRVCAWLIYPEVARWNRHRRWLENA